MTTVSKARTRWQLATSRISIAKLQNDQLESDQLEVIKKNHDILKDFMQVVTAFNKDFFYNKLQQRIKDNLNFLHKIDSNSVVLVDDFGRCTYFYSNIGPYKIFIYQPGTPAFFSSVNPRNDLAVTHDDCQQNGPILGMDCACFLADFVTHLSFLYQKNCAELLQDSHDFHPQTYEASLETCLKTFVDEDRDVHARLIEIKNLLLNVGGQYKIKSERLKHYFYAKDIEVFSRRIDEMTSTIMENMNFLNITDVQFNQILKHRDCRSTYKKSEGYVEMTFWNGAPKLILIQSNAWHAIRESILVKNGIFQDLILARNQIREKLDSIENEVKETHQRIAPNSRPSCCTRRPGSRSHPWMNYFCGMIRCSNKAVD